MWEPKSQGAKPSATELFSLHPWCWKGHLHAAYILTFCVCWSSCVILSLMVVEEETAMLDLTSYWESCVVVLNYWLEFTIVVT